MKSIVFPHGATIQDDYDWLRDDSKTNKHPDILNFINKENEFAQEVIENSGIKSLESALIKDCNSRKAIHEYEESDWLIGDYRYFYVDESIYRTKDKQAFSEDQKNVGENHELVLDATSFQGDVGFFEVSSDQQYIAFGVDYAGSEEYSVYVRDIKAQKFLSDKITNVNSNEKISQSLRWTDHSDCFIYISGDDARYCKRHNLHTDEAEDEILYYESNSSFGLNLDLTNDSQYLILTSQGTNVNEVFILPLKDSSKLKFRSILDCRNCEMSLDSTKNGTFYINYQGVEDAALFETNESDLFVKSKWKSILPCNPSRMIISVDCTADYVIIVEIEDCQKYIRISKHGTRQFNQVNFFHEEIFTFFIQRVIYSKNELEIVYMSSITPKKILSIGLDDLSTKILYDGALMNYEPNEFESKRIYTESLVPITITQKKDCQYPAPLASTTITFRFGYGAYSSAQQTWFLNSKITLLKLGFIFAVAHVRGGTEKGREWARKGKLTNKMNSFYDFIACADHLVAQNYTTSNLMTAWGRSAGGTLVAGCINMRPDLFKAVILDVPFCDVLVTLSDPSIPWSEFDRHEFGNPHIKAHFDVIQKYCPIQNLKTQNYPKILISAAMNDSRVPYWEPLKYVAKMRSLNDKCEDNIILLTDLDGGHYSLWSSGRIALRWAFLANALNVPTNSLALYASQEKIAK